MPPTLLTTAINALRYPSAANNGSDFAAGIADLAADIDPRLPKLVTALPGSPVDMQEIYLQTAAMATDNIVWHLRYRAGASGSYKWEFVGGPPWIKEVSDDQATTSAPYVDLSTVGPRVALPAAGNYGFQTKANVKLSADDYASTGVAIPGASGVAIGWFDTTTKDNAETDYGGVCVGVGVGTANSPGNATLKYGVDSGGPASFFLRMLMVTPIALG